MRQEVGKVAKAAPVLLSKALELLIGDLIKSASKVCKSKNAATVNVNHLREAVAKESTFDFLQEVCTHTPSACTCERRVGVIFSPVPLTRPETACVLCRSWASSCQQTRATTRLWDRIRRMKTRATAPRTVMLRERLPHGAGGEAGRAPGAGAGAGAEAGAELRVRRQNLAINRLRGVGDVVEGRLPQH